MHQHRFTRRGVVVLLALSVGVVPFLSSSNARGDEIGDLKSRAAQISAQISDLQAQVQADTAAVEQANYQASQIQGQIDAASKQLAEARKNEAASRHDLANYALNAYVTGGTGSVDLATLLDTGAGKIGPRQGYQSTAVGNRQELVDQLQAAQQVTSDRAATLRTERDKASAVAANAKAKRDSADQAQSKLEAIQSQLKGRLATLVAEKQAAAQRAAEARAKAAAQARAAAQAAQQQAQQQQVATQQATPSVTTPSPSPSPSPAPSPSPNPAPGPAPTGSGNGAAAVAAARSQLGVTYVWGGESPGRGFDCSGLTQWSWAQAGVSIPRTTYGQKNAGVTVSLSQAQPGDLVFYSGYGHVAMYIGGGQVIHAPHTGDVVRYASVYMDGGPIQIVRP